MAEKYRIQSRGLSFRGYQQHQLAASLDYPVEVTPSRYAIMCHCFTCTRQTLTAARVSRGLAEAGIAVLRFDFTGLGESEGDFADSHFRSMLVDIQAAAELLQTHYQPPSLLLGHSMGGTACLAASQLGARCFSALQGVVTLASPSAPEHVLHHFGPVMDELEQGRAAKIRVAGQDYPVRPSFVEDVRSYDMQAQMQHCQLPILAVRAGKDALVGPAEAEQIVAYNPSHSQLCDIAGADHLFSERGHTAQMLDEILGWIHRL